MRSRAEVHAKREELDNRLRALLARLDRGVDSDAADPGWGEATYLQGAVDACDLVLGRINEFRL